MMVYQKAVNIGVSTHSRPKAAGQEVATETWRNRVSTHSRPKAAGSAQYLKKSVKAVSTHSRPKAAGAVFANPWRY